jgi:hypothetical protein
MADTPVTAGGKDTPGTADARLPFRGKRRPRPSLEGFR